MAIMLTPSFPSGLITLDLKVATAGGPPKVTPYWFAYASEAPHATLVVSPSSFAKKRRVVLTYANILKAQQDALFRVEEPTEDATKPLTPIWPSSSKQMNVAWAACDIHDVPGTKLAVPPFELVVPTAFMFTDNMHPQRLAIPDITTSFHSFGVSGLQSFLLPSSSNLSLPFPPPPPSPLAPLK